MVTGLALWPPDMGAGTWKVSRNPELIFWDLLSFKSLFFCASWKGIGDKGLRCAATRLSGLGFVRPPSPVDPSVSELWSWRDFGSARPVPAFFLQVWFCIRVYVAPR